jgi:O-antigen/teichoic acid export membrane protein
MIRTATQVLAYQGLRLAAQAATTLVAASVLGPGAFALALAIYGIGATLGGLTGVGAGFLLLRDASIDGERLGNAWRAAVARGLATTLPLSLILVLSAVLLSPQRDATLIGTAVLIALSELVIQPFAYLCSFALQSQGNASAGAAAHAAVSLGRLLGAIASFVLPSEVGLVSYAAFIAVGAAAGATCSWALVRRRLGHVTRVGPPASRARDGLPFAASWATSVGLAEADKVLAIRVLTADAAGLYGAAYRCASALALPVSALIYALQPRLFRRATSRHAHADADLAKTTLAAVTVYSLLAGAAAYSMAGALEWALGASYAGVSNALRMMAPLSAIICLRVAVTHLLAASGHPGRRAVFELFGVMTMAVLSMGLASGLSVGPFVAVVTFSEAIVFAGCLWQIYKHRPERVARSKEN